MAAQGLFVGVPVVNVRMPAVGGRPAHGRVDRPVGIDREVPVQEDEVRGPVGARSDDCTDLAGDVRGRRHRERFRRLRIAEVLGFRECVQPERA